VGAVAIVPLERRSVWHLLAVVGVFLRPEIRCGSGVEFRVEFRVNFDRNIPCQRDFADYTSRSPGQGELNVFVLFDNRVCDVVLWLSLIRCARVQRGEINSRIINDSGRCLWTMVRGQRYGELFQTLLESLILAQDERWRRA
jgi:hypothetical protein